MERLFIYGTGGQGKVIADAANLQGTYEVAGFIDDKQTGEFVVKLFYSF